MGELASVVSCAHWLPPLDLYDCREHYEIRLDLTRVELDRPHQHSWQNFTTLDTGR
jgi:hypothetical protein